jgi:ABC-type glycerol-3-phosphate transport system substrate-binding protein
MAARLTKYDAQGNIIQLGFSPFEPGWWSWAWGYWFGGRLWDGDSRITLDSPENLRALEWMRSYSERYGENQMQTFQSGFGNFTSPQNAFLCGKVAMVIQGPWMDSLIRKFAPSLRWGAAPFPSAVPGLDGITVVQCNSICIPVGTRHPKEAFEFIKYLCSQEGSEMLNLPHGKFPPRRTISSEFIKSHSNPYIEMFIGLAKSPNAFSTPKMGVWYEYNDELTPMFESIRLGHEAPDQLARQVEQRVQGTLDEARRLLIEREGMEHARPREVARNGKTGRAIP